MNHGLIPYVGGKARLADRLVDICAAVGVDTLVDTFGGSGVVAIAARRRFKKIIYNDVDGDLVHLFRVLADEELRRRLFRKLRILPASRKIFNDDYAGYVTAGFSFSNVSCPVERARRIFYRHMFSFGGKVRCGGFQVSMGDRHGIKEVIRYRNALRKLVRVGQFFRECLIENLHYQEAIRIYGSKANVVLYCDPPYDGTEDCYSRSFGVGDHVFLAEQLSAVKARVVVSYYETDLIRNLYPADRWDWIKVNSTKNSCFTRGNKVVTNECVIVRKD